MFNGGATKLYQYTAYAYAMGMGTLEPKRYRQFTRLFSRLVKSSLARDYKAMWD